MDKTNDHPVDSPIRPFVLRGRGRDHCIGWSTHINRCPWCRKKRGLTHLELYSISGFDKKLRGYRLIYPSKDFLINNMIAVVSHPLCGPDTGYAIELDDLAGDPNRWYAHLQKKTWSPPWLKDVIWDVLLLHRKFAYKHFHPKEIDFSKIDWR